MQAKPATGSTTGPRANEAGATRRMSRMPAGARLREAGSRVGQCGAWNTASGPRRGAAEDRSRCSCRRRPAAGIAQPRMPVEPPARVRME
ncbi:hypothetical protein NA66_1001217 [Burkholderia pyrrocinia]|uniref:Uncharacterized protein n=1 Tax=Burkholderia pyrrocinia TaxID=60550 RepID=A0A318J2S4_BURPY|nr:hypothetical protein NA66_1001217 [Burkholderia pyrrocinia]SFW28768.1 hypothetical protein SAMN03159384_01050 [Burkholderia sp. NFACC33-1]SFX38603.1 hypothetical protein SAMN03159408_01145 [Burkholderia sp. NFPP32]